MDKKKNFSLSLILIGIIMFFFSCTMQLLGVSDEGLSKLELINDDGEIVKIIPASDTIISINATWCPYSRQLINFLNDPTISPYLKKFKKIFIFEDDEWPKIEKMLNARVEEKEMTNEEAQENLAALKQRAGFSPVFDPELLVSLPGEYYFLPKKSEIQWEDFPSLYSGGKEFSESAFTAVIKFLEMEESLGLVNIEKIWTKYSPILQDE